MPPALIPAAKVADLVDLLRYYTRTDDPAVQARILAWVNRLDPPTTNQRETP